MVEIEPAHSTVLAMPCARRDDATFAVVLPAFVVVTIERGYFVRYTPDLEESG